MKNAVLVSLLLGIIILTFLIGYHTNWTQWEHTPIVIITISMFLIRLVSGFMKASSKILYSTFIWLSFINFAVYSYASFYDFVGGIFFTNSVLTVLFIICVILTYLYYRFNKKSFTIFSNIYTFIVFIVAMIVLLDGIAIGGMGV